MSLLGITRTCPGSIPRLLCIISKSKPDVKLVKQQQQQFRSEIMDAIESEVKKLIDSDFVREEQHPDWLVNIVPVPKKNGKI